MLTKYLQCDKQQVRQRSDPQIAQLDLLIQIPHCHTSSALNKLLLI